MSSLDASRLQVVPSATHLQIELLKRPVPFIDFDNDEAEQAYGELDLQLARRLDQLASDACGNRSPQDLVLTNWDWTASDSRAITVDRSILSVDLINAMLGTLTGAYASWRIHLRVSQDLAADDDEMGSACLFADVAIVEKSLCTCLGVEA